MRRLASIETLAEFGHALRRPTADFLRDGIYELRIKRGRVNHRILYFFEGKPGRLGPRSHEQDPDADLERPLRRKKAFQEEVPGSTDHDDAPSRRKPRWEKRSGICHPNRKWLRTTSSAVSCELPRTYSRKGMWLLCPHCCFSTLSLLITRWANSGTAKLMSSLTRYSFPENLQSFDRSMDA